MRLKLFFLGFYVPEDQFLIGQDTAHFVVDVFDQDLGLEVDFIVVFGAAAVLFLLSVLAHHDERRLNCGHAGEDKIQQNEWIWVERTRSHERIDRHPQDEHAGKGENERPAACEFCDSVGCALAQSIGLAALLYGVDRDLAAHKQSKYLLV